MKIKNIVTIGGGTGSFTLLSGLKKYPVNISAIVSMADNGGSTGILRDELGVLPPGDVRQCLIALSDASDTLRNLMNYRFENGGLQGHSFGNLFVSALEKTCGGMSHGLEEASRILNVSGRVYPVTEDDMQIVVTLEDGSVLHGEHQLDVNERIRKDGLKLIDIRLEKPVAPNHDAIRAITQADMIILGPGDQYSSVVPNLLIPEIANAIAHSHAKVVYVSNLTNKRGLTDSYTVKDYVDSIEKYIGKDRVNFVIYSNRKPKQILIDKYEQFEGKGAMVSFREYPERHYKLVKANVVSTTVPLLTNQDQLSTTRAFIRHDSPRLARAIMFLLDFESTQKVINDIV